MSRDLFSMDSGCPDCQSSVTRPKPDVTRRSFLKQTGMATAGLAAAGLVLPAGATIGVRPVVADDANKTGAEKPVSETLVKQLYDSLTPMQRDEVCFEWNHTDDRGLLRTHVSNNWHITDEKFNVTSPFFTSDQQEIIREIFFGLYNPEFKERLLKQLKDDAGGYGPHQTIAIFGTPGTGQFEFVMTGRHLTIRCDGDSTDHVAFGGPIFYGHAAQGFNEKPDHPGNVYWHQAVAANNLFKMLDGKQREAALVEVGPPEAKVGFKGKDLTEGVAVADMTADQKSHVQDVLKSLLEPYRATDQAEARRMLDSQGGLDACRLAFYRKTANGQSLDLGDDGVWDVWRLEGPSLVWHYRGAPHVHVWVNIADNPAVPINARG